MVISKVVLVRHGETIWNLEGRQQGHLDSPLSPAGITQAESLGMRLQMVPFKHLYTSDLGRAVRTAEIIGQRTGHTPVLEPRLRERNLGIFQGMKWREVCAKYPDLSEAYRKGGPTFVIPEGESLEQRTDRSMECITDLARKHPGERIVAVTHSGVLDGVIRRVLGIGLDAPRRFRLLNASFNVFHYTSETWYLESWNDTGHLALESMDDE